MEPAKQGGAVWALGSGSVGGMRYGLGRFWEVDEEVDFGEFVLRLFGVCYAILDGLGVVIFFEEMGRQKARSAMVRGWMFPTEGPVLIGGSRACYRKILLRGRRRISIDQSASKRELGNSSAITVTTLAKPQVTYVAQPFRSPEVPQLA